MAPIETDAHGVRRCTIDTDSHPVFRIVEVEANCDSFDETADRLGVPTELVEEAMLYFYDNPYLIHQDALTAQFRLWKRRMENALQARAQIRRDCPACETGMLTPERLFPSNDGSSPAHAYTGLTDIVCSKCDYDYQLQDTRRGFDEGVRLRAENGNQRLTVEGRLVDIDDATLWYLLRDHADNSVTHVTHQTLTERYHVHQDGSDCE